MYEGLVISAVKYANQGQKKMGRALKTRKKPPVLADGSSNSLFSWMVFGGFPFGLLVFLVFLLDLD